jgi:hypothetical protein
VKHPADPTPRSPRDVLADRGYRMVVSEQASSQIGGHPMNHLVVLHCGSETYWATNYPAAMPSIAVSWKRVEPVIETRTTYRPVA